jgi:hypothetical protein
MLDDPRDIGKYRVMSQAELNREKDIYNEVADTVRKRGSSAHKERRRTVQVGPPAGKRARAVQNRAWDDKIKAQREAAAAAAEARIPSHSSASAGYTVDRGPTASGGRPGSAPPARRRPDNATGTGTGNVSMRTSQQGNTRRSTREDPDMETLKYKYVQNLDVIEKLAAEKEEMERTIQMLQSGQKLPDDKHGARRDTGYESADRRADLDIDYDRDRDRDRDRDTAEVGPPTYTEEPDETRYAWKPQQGKGTERLSAAEASRLFDRSSGGSPARARGRSPSRSTSFARSGSRDSRDLNGFGGRPDSPGGVTRSKSFDGPKRSTSAPRTRAAAGVGISYELQADYDRCGLRLSPTLPYPCDSCTPATLAADFAMTVCAFMHIETFKYGFLSIFSC